MTKDEIKQKRKRVENMQTYSYVSPSGAGMTPNKELAERMNTLHDLYLKAKAEDRPQILEEEERLLLLVKSERKAILALLERILTDEEDQITDGRLKR